MNQINYSKEEKEMKKVSSIAEGLAQIIHCGGGNTEEEAVKIANAVEKMLDTVSGSAERKEAKQGLIRALLREFETKQENACLKPTVWRSSNDPCNVLETK